MPHTSGPWFLIGGYDEFARPSGGWDLHPTIWNGQPNDGPRALIGHVNPWDGEPDRIGEARANAALIAAAPDLLEACKELLEAYSMLMPSTRDGREWVERIAKARIEAREAIAKATDRLAGAEQSMRAVREQQA